MPAKQPISTPELIDGNRQADTAFKYRRVIIFVLLLSATLSLLPFFPEDIDFFAGGITGATFPHNLLGAAGAFFGWSMLMLFGLASYALMALAITCSLRRLVWRGGLRKSSWEYHLAILCFCIGWSLLLATFPECFPTLTARLNISTIPGGVLGQHFCAPGTGWIHVLFNTTGSVIVSLLAIIISGSVVWFYDWRETTQKLLQLLRERWQNKADITPAPAPEPPPAVLNSEIPIEAPLADNSSGAGFKVRRGAASIAAARAAQEAFNTPATPEPRPPAPFTPVAPPPPPQQPPLPLEATHTAPQPQPVTPPAPPIQTQPPQFSKPYLLPSPTLLLPSEDDNALASANEIDGKKRIIQATIDEFKIDAEVVNAIPGPQVTLFEVEMGNGVLVNVLGRIQSNISMNLCSRLPVRMLLPILGKNCAGIEVPNKVRRIVTAHELFTSDEWNRTKQVIPLMLGKSITDEAVMVDLQQAPHLLVAGTSGSGKSVCMNLMIQSILQRFRPDELKLIMFDPKFVEFQSYSKLPHLIAPIINEPKQVGLVLNWAIAEMNRRYKLLPIAGVRNLLEFNNRQPSPQPLYDDDGELIPDKLPLIVIIIDELGDIMAQSDKEVTRALVVLAAKSRAAGIHMIIATQRPDSKIIDGNIKANFPWRIALRVTDGINSRVILDQPGAETLLGNGDMLFKGESIVRIQGGRVTNDEISALVNYCSLQGEPEFNSTLVSALEAQEDASNGLRPGGDVSPEQLADTDTDAETELLQKAVQVLKTTKRPTISSLQRMLRIGYNKAASLMDELEDAGYVGPQPAFSGLREIYWDNIEAAAARGSATVPPVTAPAPPAAPAEPAAVMADDFAPEETSAADDNISAGDSDTPFRTRRMQADSDREENAAPPAGLAEDDTP